MSNRDIEIPPRDMDFSSITTLAALELFYHANRKFLPDPIDDLLYDILQGRDVKKVLHRPNNLGQSGAASLTLALCFLTRLQRIEIPYANIGDEGVREMGRALPRLKELTSVGLAGNKIGPMGVFYLTSAISDLPGLIALDLSDNIIHESGIGLLADSLSPHIQRLGLRSIGIDISASPALCALLSTRPRLKSIDLQFNRCMGEFCPEVMFRKSVGLEKVMVTGCKLSSLALGKLFAMLPVMVGIQELGTGFACHTPSTVSSFACILPSLPYFTLMTVGDFSEQELYARYPAHPPLPVKCSTLYR